MLVLSDSWFLCNYNAFEKPSGYVQNRQACGIAAVRTITIHDEKNSKNLMVLWIFIYVMICEKRFPKCALRLSPSYIKWKIYILLHLYSHSIVFY